MARIKKFSPEQNLSAFQTFIVDDTTNSDYFRITEFKDTFTGGKNGFLIEGSEYLKESTEIKIELLDVNGDPLYFEPGDGIPEYYEGISKLVAVYVYEDTPIGLGKIIVLGELKEYDNNGVTQKVPDEWEGIYNVKWGRSFNINKNLANEDKVRFYRRPDININEIVKPIFSGNPETVTQTGSLSGIPLVPNEETSLTNFSLPTSYRLKIDSGSFWTGSVKGQQINFDEINYSPIVDDIVNDVELVVSPPYTENNLVKSFKDKAYSVTFPHLEGVGDLATALTGSFAEINITDLGTFVGDVARVKVFRRSQSNLTDFEFIQDIQLESNEILRDVETLGKRAELYGQFTEDVISNFWETSSNQTEVSINQNFLFNSVKLNSVPESYFNTTKDFIIKNEVEYTLDFNVRKEENISGDYLLVFLSGSFNDSSVRHDIIKIDSNNTLLEKTNINTNIIANAFDSSKLFIEVNGSGWYINNLSLKASQETSFSPDEITFIQTVPKTLPAETFDFRFDFYDINNNFIPIQVDASKTFTGGNLNLFEKNIDITPDNLYFPFGSASSPANPIPPKVINFDVETTLITGSITYTSAAYDASGGEISASEYAGGQYPGLLTDFDINGGTEPFLRVEDFTGSREDIDVQYIQFRGEAEGVSDSVIITRNENGKGGVSFEIRPYRGTVIKNKDDKRLEIQAIRVDGINRIELQSGLKRNFSDAKLHVLSSSIENNEEVNTYISLSQAITDPNFLEDVVAGETGSGEIDYNASFGRDAIDNELTVYLMDGTDENSILTSLILTDLKDGLGNGQVTTTAEQFGINVKPLETSGFNPLTSLVTASFYRRGTSDNPLSASLEVIPSMSREPKTTIPHFYLFYETGAFDDTITVSVQDEDGTFIDSGVPGVTVPFYEATENKQLNFEFTYIEPITSASVTANKSIFIVPDGFPSQDAITIDIEPNPISVAADYKGEVFDYDIADTDINITQGNFFLINTSSGDPGTFNLTNIVSRSIEFENISGESTTTMRLSGFESMSALSASISYDFDIFPYFTSSLVTASKTQRFTKVVEGAGPIDITISPQNITFGADEIGYVDNYSSADTQITVKQSEDFLVYDGDNTGTPGTFVTTSISASNISFNEISASNNNSTVVGDETLFINGISNMPISETSASLTYNFKVYPYSLKAGVAGVPLDVSKTQTFSKVNNGKTARKVTISPSPSNTVVYDSDGLPNPTSITLSAEAFNTSGSAYFEFKDSDGTSLAASSTTPTITLSDIPPANDSETYTVELRDGSSDGLVLDTDFITISSVKAGTVPYSVTLENDNATVVVEQDDSIYFDNTGTIIRAFKGNEELQSVEVYDEQATDPNTFLPIGTFNQFSASVEFISSFLTKADLGGGKTIVSPTGEKYASSSVLSNWTDPQGNPQGVVRYKIDFENGRGTQFVEQTFSTAIQGSTGAGITFMGEWEVDVEYISTNIRKDVVEYEDEYYLANRPHTSVASGDDGPPDTENSDNAWDEFGETFSSVATDILFSQDVYAERTINIGTSGSTPVIALNSDQPNQFQNPFIAIGQNPVGFTSGGIYLGYSPTEDVNLSKPVFSAVGDAEVFIKGTIDATNGTIGDWVIGDEDEDGVLRSEDGGIVFNPTIPEIQMYDDTGGKKLFLGRRSTLEGIAGGSDTFTWNGGASIGSTTVTADSTNPVKTENLNSNLTNEVELTPGNYQVTGISWPKLTINNNLPSVQKKQMNVIPQPTYSPSFDGQVHGQGWRQRPRSFSVALFLDLLNDSGNIESSQQLGTGFAQGSSSTGGAWVAERIESERIESENDKILFQSVETYYSADNATKSDIAAGTNETAIFAVTQTIANAKFRFRLRITSSTGIITDISSSGTTTVNYQQTNTTFNQNSNSTYLSFLNNSIDNEVTILRENNYVEIQPGGINLLTTDNNYVKLLRAETFDENSTENVITLLEVKGGVSRFEKPNNDLPAIRVDGDILPENNSNSQSSLGSNFQQFSELNGVSLDSLNTRMVGARCRFVVNSTTNISFSNAYNVASVTRENTGVYRVSFENTIFQGLPFVMSYGVLGNFSSRNPGDDEFTNNMGARLGFSHVDINFKDNNTDTNRDPYIAYVIIVGG